MTDQTTPTRQENAMSLLNTLATYCAVNDPWRPDYRQRQAEAEAVMLAEVEAMADAGERDALRVWEALETERQYAERNALAGSKMHRTVPYYAAVAHAQLAILQADATPPQPGDETAWCTECRKRRVVEEVDPTASTYSGQHELGWTATHLACGHTMQTEPKVIGRSPGGESAAEAMTQDATRRRIERTHAYHSYED